MPDIDVFIHNNKITIDPEVVAIHKDNVVTWRIHNCHPAVTSAEIEFDQSPVGPGPFFFEERRSVPAAQPSRKRNAAVKNGHATITGKAPGHGMDDGVPYKYTVRALNAAGGNEVPAYDPQIIVEDP